MIGSTLWTGVKTFYGLGQEYGALAEKAPRIRYLAPECPQTLKQLEHWENRIGFIEAHKLILNKIERLAFDLGTWKGERAEMQETIAVLDQFERASKDKSKALG